MGIGASVFLIAIGAIITVALNVKVGGISLDIVGWILMGAGAIGLVWTTLLLTTRRKSVSVSTRTGGGAPEETLTKETSRPSTPIA